jgi:hypothetical protein
LVQTGSNWIKLDQDESDGLFDSNQMKLVQIGSIQIKLAQIGSSQIKVNQMRLIGTNWTQFDQIG